MPTNPIHPDGSRDDSKHDPRANAPQRHVVGAIAKICVRCGVDCSATPREKDAQGRYTCGPCAEKARSLPSTPPAVDAPAINATSAPPVRAASPSGKPAPIRPSFVRIEPAKSDNDDDPPIELEGLDPGAINALMAAESAAKVATLQPAVTGPAHPCGKCGRALAPDVQVCSVCGFDNRKGYTGPRSAKKLNCAECGYDLRGLTSAKCPECGTLVPIRSAKAEMEDYNARESRRVARNACLRPVIIFVVSMSIIVLIYALNGDIELIVKNLIIFAIRVAVGIIVYFICCLTFLGFDAPMRLTALRLLAIYTLLHAMIAVFNSAFNFQTRFALGSFRFGLLYIVHIGLLISELDMDKADALIMATATSLAMFTISVLVLYYTGWILK
jgi:hypothetical protein